jgi:AcrR family transcriptional regulator
MSESEAIKAIRRAPKQRARADALRQQATEDLRGHIRRAQDDGVSIAQIAREAGLSRQGVYDLLGDRQPA